jgi:hypothetical protein
MVLVRRVRVLPACAAHVEVDNMHLNLLQWHPNFVKLPLLVIFSEFYIEGVISTAKS